MTQNIKTEILHKQLVYLLTFIASPKTLNNFHSLILFLNIWQAIHFAVIDIYIRFVLALCFPKLYVNPTRNEVLSLSMLFL